MAGLTVSQRARTSPGGAGGDEEPVRVRVHAIAAGGGFCHPWPQPRLRWRVSYAAAGALFFV
jgi:hypothetical protein